ncbi:MAG: Tad domain-containing protein, partial [Deltaproteobacteria bacterium]|nr:Tad domain-containing protein [Deltaproteobacteria bacterium]
MSRWQGSLKDSTKKRGRLGQISVLIVFSLIPMLTLFAFTINIGMLVNAKISLQNATDLAAYAGAATQARMLTNISHLNYYLRQVYKKFIFRYYVLGNISQRCYPKNVNMPGQCTGAGTDPKSATKFFWRNVDTQGN